MRRLVKSESYALLFVTDTGASVSLPTLVLLFVIVYSVCC
jgi:hypothetical protein